MTTFGRFATFGLSLLLLGGLSLTAGAVPAQASISTLCTGYAGCAQAGMSDSGYGAASRTMYWRMYAGHNCTNYAAYRMVRAGLANSRPWSGDGNATNWGASMKSITNATPSVGAIAWWRAGVRPAGSAGHVAYVERVVSAEEIILSQDSWNGNFSWTRITRSGGGWPSGFIHFRDVALLNTKAPTITGSSKVGSALTASAGTWSPVNPTIAYQWLQNGAAVAGATSSTLALKQAQQGKQITVRVTASRPGYPARAVTSAPTPAVQPGALTGTAQPAITGYSQVGETLSADPGTWSPTPDAVHYQWQADGVPIGAATGSTLAVDPSLLGKSVSVTVTAVKAGYPDAVRTSAATAPVQQGTLAPLASPTVGSASQPGGTLTVVLQGAPPQAQAAVQWLRSGRPVPGATRPTYRLSAADLGSRLVAQVTLTRPGYATLRTLSAASPVVRATPVLRVTTVTGRGRLAAYVSVTASGVRTVTGVIQVRSRGRLLRQTTLHGNMARVSLTHLHRGSRVFRFRYLASATVAGTDVRRRLRIG